MRYSIIIYYLFEIMFYTQAKARRPSLTDDSRLLSVYESPFAGRDPSLSSRLINIPAAIAAAAIAAAAAAIAAAAIAAAAATVSGAATAGTAASSGRQERRNETK